jgi:hypothetical protein
MEGERVVTSGQFMLDSESQLREAIQKMLNPNASPAPAAVQIHSAHEASPSTIASAQSVSAPSSYVCPMPEHADIKYNHRANARFAG